MAASFGHAVLGQVNPAARADLRAEAAGIKITRGAKKIMTLAPPVSCLNDSTQSKRIARFARPRPSSRTSARDALRASKIDAWKRAKQERRR